MNTPIEVIMLIFALFLGLLGIIGFVLFCWLGSKWVIGGSEDPMPTKDDVRTIVQSENQIITGKLDEILEAVKDGKNDGNKNKL